MDQTFQKAKPEVKAAAGQVVTAVQSQDYAQAAAAVQSLSSRPDLTKDQRLLTARAMLTINGLLEAAQAKGDEKAAAALKYQHMSK